MTTPTQALLQFAGLQPSLVAPNSRYIGIDQATLSMRGSHPIAYLRRRFLPQAEQMAQVQTHEVKQGERLDHIAARYLSDPELFWRICDANAAMKPEDLTAGVGRILRIALPPGIPGGRSF